LTTPIPEGNIPMHISTNIMNNSKKQIPTIIKTNTTPPALSSIGREALVRWNHDCSREMPDAPHLFVVGARSSDY
jgi:hypothetical protein